MTVEKCSSIRWFAHPIETAECAVNAVKQAPAHISCRAKEAIHNVWHKVQRIFDYWANRVKDLRTECMNRLDVVPLSEYRKLSRKVAGLETELDTATVAAKKASDQYAEFSQKWHKDKESIVNVLRQYGEKIKKLETPKT